MLASQLRTAIDGKGAEMMAMLQEITAGPPTEETAAHDPPIHAANAAVQQDIQLQMLPILQDIQANNAHTAGRGDRGGRDSMGGRIGNGGRGGRGNRNRRTPDNATFERV